MSTLRFALRLALTRQALLKSATPRVAPQLTPSVGKCLMCVSSCSVLSTKLQTGRFVWSGACVPYV